MIGKWNHGIALTFEKKNKKRGKEVDFGAKTIPFRTNANGSGVLRTYLWVT